MIFTNCRDLSVFLYSTPFRDIRVIFHTCILLQRQKIERYFAGRRLPDFCCFFFSDRNVSYGKYENIVTRTRIIVQLYIWISERKWNSTFQGLISARKYTHADSLNLLVEPSAEVYTRGGVPPAYRVIWRAQSTRSETRWCCDVDDLLPSSYVSGGSWKVSRGHVILFLFFLRFFRARPAASVYRRISVSSRSLPSKKSHV